MFQNQLDPAEGLLLVQNKESRSNAAIHMFFVGMDLGVVWLDNAVKVVDIQLAESWKPLFTPEYPARYIMEVNPQRMKEFSIGDELEFEEIHSV